MKKTHAMREEKAAKYRNVIIEYLKEDPDFSNIKLARLIIKEKKLAISERYLSEAIGAVRKSMINIDEEPYSMTENTWEVEDGNYVISSRNGKITLTVEEVDRIFYEYSKHGLDLSQEAIRRKHNIGIWQWHAIKRSLWLYKDSNIFSPWTEENTDKDRLRDIISKKLEFKDADKKRLVEEEHNKILHKSYNKTIDSLNRKEFAYHTMADRLMEWAPKMKAFEIKRYSPSRSKISDLVVAIADLHVGAEVEELRNTPRYNLADSRRNMLKIANIVNEYEAERVHVFFLGDMIESFTGTNHPNSWKGLGYGMYGAEVVKAAVDTIQVLTDNLLNLASVTAVAGNHDRATSKKEEDDKGEIAQLIFYILDKAIGHEVDVDFDPLAISKQVGDINYILTHGDKGVVSKKNPSGFIMDYGDPSMFNVILSGHLHSRNVYADAKRFRWIQVPAVFPGNWYSESNGWNAMPGFITIRDDGCGKPTATDHPL